MIFSSEINQLFRISTNFISDNDFAEFKNFFTSDLKHEVNERFTGESVNIRFSVEHGELCLYVPLKNRSLSTVWYKLKIYDKYEERNYLFSMIQQGMVFVIKTFKRVKN